MVKQTHTPFLFMAWVVLFFSLPRLLLAQCITCNSDVSFTTNPEFSGAYGQASQVDVDQGNSPETFVTSAYWQIYGSAPPPSVVTTQANNLRTLPYWRRIDVVNTFLNASGKSLPKIYSEPWQSEPQLLTPPCKNVTRDVGAVCMFFFSCPSGTNCSMDWADTHVEGMSSPSTLLAYGANSTGYYTSSSDAGFWYRELMDARYAGLSYLLPNCYGPDITNGSIDNLASALGTINSMGVTAQVKIGLFDDTSGWNNPADFNFAPWNAGPWSSRSGPENLSAAGVTAAANEIFQDKWQPFFSRIPSQYWYEVNGHPLITVYYGGTLYIDGSSQPTVATIIQLLKNDFQTTFGVTPYVVIDIGFSYGSATVADNQFVWNTLSSPYVPATNLSTYTNGGITADLAMVKWDPTQRDNGSTAIANPTCEGTTLIKNDSLLQSILSRTTNDTFLTLATWNDLGEGTGINRNYDYYVDGQWEPPDYFMKDIRHSQAQVTCVPGTATATPTITPTFTPTATATPTFTQTATITLTFTPTATVTRVSTFTRTTPSWAGNLPIYEVDLDSFSSSQTFQALQGQIPRLQALGVGIIWLNPIYPRGVLKSVDSPYCDSSFVSINPTYGTNTDFQNLVNAVHAAGMYLILDWVANQTSWDSPLITSHPEYYVHDGSGNIEEAYNGCCLSDVAQLDYTNAGLQTYMIGAMSYWVQTFGVDGFRCDSAWNTPISFWNSARSALSTIKPVFMLAEDSDNFSYDTAFDSDYDWDLLVPQTSPIADMIQIANGTEPATQIDVDLAKQAGFPAPPAFMKMRFTSNYDEWKNIGTPFQILGGSNQAQAFAILTCTLQGKPLIYNGQEIGYNTASPSNLNPPPIDWTASATTAFWTNFYSLLFHLYQNNPAVNGGSFTKLASNQDASIYTFVRQNGSNKVLVILNLSGNTVNFTVNNSALAGNYTELFTSAVSTIGTSYSATFSPWQYTVLVTGGSVPTTTPTFVLSPTPTSTFTITPSPTVTMTPTNTFTVTPSYTATYTPTPVYAGCNGLAATLDGILNESVWGLSSFSLISNTNCIYSGCGTTDLGASAQFKTAWNSTGLWIGINVNDPGTLFANTTGPWNGSGVEIFLDLNNTRGGYNTGTGNYNDPNTYQWAISYNASIIAQYHNTTIRAIQAASVATAGTGYTMEIEIPWTTLGVSAPVAGSLSGLDVAVDVSNAAGTGRDHQIAAFNGNLNLFDQTPADWGTLKYQSCSVLSSTPTFTNSFTPTLTVTASATPTLSFTPSLSFTGTPSLTATSTQTASLTPTLSLTPTGTATGTTSFTFSPTITNTPAGTGTPVFTSTPTFTFSSTASLTSTLTFTKTATYSPTETPTATQTLMPATSTATATFTNTPTRTFTASATFTPTLTFTTTGTGTSSNTFTQTFTSTVSSTSTATFTNTFTKTITPTSTVTLTFTSSFTPTISFTPTNTASKTQTGTPTQTATPTGNINAQPIVYPNPVMGGQVHIHLLLPKPAKVTVDVYTLAFREVGQVVFLNQPVGVDMVLDLTDKSGRPLADGLYYISVTNSLSSVRKITKLMILR
jgi:glycosidase